MRARHDGALFASNELMRMIEDEDEDKVVYDGNPESLGAFAPA